MAEFDSGAEAENLQWFATTHWSVVFNAKSDDTTEAAQAVSQLCKIYLEPVRSYVGRSAHNPADADDLTQQFFARFLQKKHYRAADPGRGRFRSFLLTSVKHFLINESARANAQKRGGGQRDLSLNETATEGGHPRIEPKDDRTAETAYEIKWALTLLDRVRRRLQSEYATSGRGDWFEELEKFLPGHEGEMTYAEAGVRFGVPEGTIKSDVSRLKRRYRELLREEIANTVSTPAEIDDELRHLITVVAQRA